MDCGDGLVVVVVVELVEHVTLLVVGWEGLSYIYIYHCSFALRQCKPIIYEQ